MATTAQGSVGPCRRRASIGALALLAAMLGAGPAQGGQFVPSTAGLACDETVIIDVEVDASVLDLRGFTLTLQFDPGVIAPRSVEAGSLLTQAACSKFFTWLNPFPGANTVEVDGSLLGCGVDGPGSIVRIQLEGAASGQSALHAAVAHLRNSLNQPIPFSLPDGSVSFSCSVVRFDPPIAAIGCDQTLTVGVNIDNAVGDLRGFSMVFEYALAVVAPVAVQAGPAVTGAACGNFFVWLNPAAHDGTIEVDAGLLGCSIDGPATIVTLVFQGVVDGISPVRCTAGSIFRDSTNSNIPFQREEATIQHNCPIVSAPESWSALKGRFQ